MVIEELYTRLGFKVDPKGIDKAKSSLSSFKKWVGGLALGAGLVSLAKTGLDAAMTIEGLTTDFEVMSGSAEKANNLLGEIATFAAKTPFDKIGLSGAAKTLMAFGIESEKVLPTLKMLGDVSLGDQNKLNGLALVFGQIQSTGKLMGQDLLQLINQGFNPLTEISKKTGISVSDLKDAMAKGAISADMVTEAFKSATSAGGLFYNGLEKRSETLAGKISTLKDNFVTALQNMAEAFMPLMKAGVDMLVAFDWTPIVASIQSVGEAMSALPEMLETIATWARRLAPLVYAVFAPRINAMVMQYVASMRSAIVSSGIFARVQGVVQRAALASGAAMGYQVTAIGLLKSAMFSLKATAISSFKAIGLAMKTALGPIGIALLAIEGFVEAYNYLSGKAERDATEDQLRQARGVFKNAAVYDRKTREQVVTDAEKRLAQNRQRAAELQEIAGRGGPGAGEASKELAKLSKEMKGQESWVNALRQVYTELTGLEWTSRTWEWGVKDPKLGGDNREFLAAFADLEKVIKDSENATKKQTKATEDNTAAQKKFDISALSRQAFDAAFNVKLRELTLGTI